MKKATRFLLICAALCTAALVSNKASAQLNPVTGAQYLFSQYGNNSDTLTNSGTHYLTSNLIKGSQKTVEVWLNDSSLTGTLAATATFQYSGDGRTWYGFNKDSTYTLTSSTPTVGWHEADFGAAYLRIKLVFTGTQSTRVYAGMITRKSLENQ